MEANKRFCLHDLPLFDNLERSVFSTVCRHAAIKKHIRRGEYLYHQGDPSDTLYLVKEGSFKLIRVTSDGREVILHLAGCGEVLAEAALFRQGIHPASAVALEDARVCALNRERMEEVIQSNPDLALQVIYSLGNRLYSSWEQAVEIRAGSTQDKVLNLFIRLAGDHGERCSDGIRIQVSLTQQEIADFVGASRVMVARALKTLANRNYLAKKDRFYILKDRCF
ncbi:MAG: Crp/Fnr family transcriptional regulator [Bacillota bacterium]|nr:Crp/Fnr family transcriptional regulator [Bacillota bacterium]MDW7683242.1 Crp/Fnr family transcriptional regulator [Bacillota bacterium]